MLWCVSAAAAASIPASTGEFMDLRILIQRTKVSAAVFEHSIRSAEALLISNDNPVRIIRTPAILMIVRISAHPQLWVTVVTKGWGGISPGGFWNNLINLIRYFLFSTESLFLVCSLFACSALGKGATALFKAP